MIILDESGVSIFDETGFYALLDEAGVTAIPFPGGNTDLDLRVELNLAGSWTDISTYVFEETSTITRGTPNESTQATPSSFVATLNNADGRFSSLNPTGPYFGSLGLNTEIRVSIPETTSYLRLQDEVSYASAAITTPSAGFKIYVDATLDNWQDSQTIAAQSDTTSGNNCWRLETDPYGGLWFFVTATGGTSESFFGLSYANFGPFIGPNKRFAFIVAYDPSTNTATWSTAGGTTLGSSTYSTSTTIFASSAATTVGAAPLNATAAPGMTGNVWEFKVLTLAGATTADINFMTQTPGATSFSDPQGHTWTVHNNGTGEISARKYRFHGEVAAWPQNWAPIGPNATVALTAAGSLRRMGRSNAPIDSAMYRACQRLTGNLAPVAYWSCEDGAAAQSLTSSIGGPSIGISGGTKSLASDSSFLCSQALPTMNGCSFTGSVPKHAMGNANVLRFLLKVPAGGDTDGSVIARMQTSGFVQLMTLEYGNAGTLRLLTWDGDGNNLTDTGAGTFTGLNGGLFRVSMEMTDNGGNIKAAVVVVQVGATSGLSLSSTLASRQVNGIVTRVDINPRASALLTGTVFGHVTVQEYWESLFDQAGPVAAWNNEPAGARFGRLCGEEGIPFRGRGNMNDTVPMGSQGMQTLATLLQECVDADRGMWLEPRQVLGFGYRNRVTLGNQYAAIPLDYNQDQLDDNIQPTLDDQLLANDVTATSPTGASSRQILDDGSAMAVGTIGRYDTSVNMNVQDSGLDDAALWIVHEGTVNEPRYPQLGIDLSNRALSATLYAAALDADIGDRLTVANPPAHLPPGQIDQVLMGATETLSRRTLDEGFNGRPMSPWNVPYTDSDPSGGVWNVDTDGSSTTSSVTSGATAFQVTTAAGNPIWTTAAGDFPFDIQVGGERMTVTNITGGSSPQTFTVKRSVNGIVKTHSAGEDVRLYTPPIISL